MVDTVMAPKDICFLIADSHKYVTVHYLVEGAKDASRIKVVNSLVVKHEDSPGIFR